MPYMEQLPDFQTTPLGVVEQRYKMVQCYLRKEERTIDILNKFKVTSPDFYKYLHRFNLYGRVGLQRLKRGAKVPHNKTPANQERKVASLYKKHPYFSSYELNELIGLNPRTIQRIYKSNNLVKTYKPKEEKKPILEKLKKAILKEKREKKSKGEF